MRVKITQVFIENDKDIHVEFSAEIGNCKASWMGVKPMVGDIYEVEIEIPSILKWGRDILACKNPSFQMKINENTVSLIGMLDTIDDAFASLRLENSIVLLEVEGTPFEEKRFVEVVADKIVVYDTEI